MFQVLYAYNVFNSHKNPWGSCHVYRSFIDEETEAFSQGHTSIEK